MWRTVYVVTLCASVVFSFERTCAAITIDTVPVGNPGNKRDPTSNINFSLGAVAYNYSIGKYDVTVGQYTTFLNAVAATDPYLLYNTNMATDLTVAGIARNGSDGNYVYSVIGSPNKPVTYVSWGDAARFSNWLANGQPTGAQGPGTTETGSYALNGAVTEPALAAITRGANSTWVIPTQNEWYKAAFYNPKTNSYYSSPFSSNTLWTSAPPGNTPNTGNFKTDDGLNRGNFAITGSANYDPSQNYLSDVGAYTASASPSGAFDMGGDVYQWAENYGNNPYGVDYNGGRPGHVTLGSAWLSSTAQDATVQNSNDEYSSTGFRVAVVPEPSSILLLGLSGIGLFFQWRTAKRV